jgi:23S rRNA G2445 N2-methylase RlmL
LRDLYAALGNVARKRFAGWTLAVVAADPALAGQIGVPLQPALKTRHGGVPIQVWSGRVPNP